MDTSGYPRSIKIPDGQLRELAERALRRHSFRGDWNYNLTPGHSLGVVSAGRHIRPVQRLFLN